MAAPWDQESIVIASLADMRSLERLSPDICSGKDVKNSASIATVYSAAVDWDPLPASGRTAQGKRGKEARLADDARLARKCIARSCDFISSQSSVCGIMDILLMDLQWRDSRRCTAGDFISSRASPIHSRRPISSRPVLLGTAITSTASLPGTICSPQAVT
jgi:hypothetical protein